MQSHFVLMILFAGFVSLIFGVLMRDDPIEQCRTGAAIFTGFVLVGLLFTWLMYPFPL
ncbi:MAG: hypothetical protein ACJ0H0_02140 [Vicinamibacterales bacterium]